MARDEASRIWGKARPRPALAPPNKLDGAALSQHGRCLTLREQFETSQLR